MSYYVTKNQNGEFVITSSSVYNMSKEPNHKIIKFPLEGSFTVNNADINFELLKKLTGADNKE